MSKRIAGFAVGAALGISMHLAQAMSFEYLMDQNGREHLVLSGPIVSGDAAQFKRMVSADPARFLRNTLILDSPGGEVREAMEMAKLFRRLLVTVNVFPPAHCASACFLLYVGAPARYATGVPMAALGVHRPSYSKSGVSMQSPDQADRAHSTAFNSMSKWLQEQLVPQDLIDLLLARPSTDIYWLTVDDVNRLGSRAPWYEEWVLARCPDIVSAERFMYTTNSSPAAEDRYRKASDCEAKEVIPFQEKEILRLGTGK